MKKFLFLALTTIIGCAPLTSSSSEQSAFGRGFKKSLTQGNA